MRRLLALALAVMPTMTHAQSLTGTDWELLAIDGVFFDARATLTFGADGSVSGKAPCNGWSTRNAAELPALSLRGIRATRMACAEIDKEQAFFDALPQMTDVRREGLRNLVLSGPDGRTMEFVPMVMNSMTRCLTCPPEE